MNEPAPQNSISLLALIGEDCLSSEDGRRIYDLIAPIVLQGGTVLLDFGSVNSLASPFLNSAIGRLLSQINEKTLRDRVRFLNLNSDMKADIELVIENASEYFADPSINSVVFNSVRNLAEQR